MPIILQLEDGRRISLTGPLVTIGREARCTVPLTNDSRILPRHAQIKQVGDRWLIEAETGVIQIGDAAPARVNWLIPGCKIRLSSQGPTLIFDPVEAGSGVVPQATLWTATDSKDASESEEPRSLTSTQDNSNADSTTATRSTTTIVVPQNTGVVLLVVVCIAMVGLVTALILPFRLPLLERGSSARNGAAGQPPATTSAVAGNNESQGKREPARLPPPAWNEVVKPYEEAVVCIALEYKGFTFPYATGWIARGDRIVTTASVVVQLEAVMKDGFGVVIHHQGRVTPIQSMGRHASYNADLPADRTSQRYNLGWLVPENMNVAPTCLVAAEEDWTQMTLESHLLSMGISNSLADNEPYDPLKVRMMQFPVQLTGSDHVPHENVPLFKVAVTLPKTAEGSPVFNDRGRVVGVLAPVGTAITLVTTKGLTQLLN